MPPSVRTFVQVDDAELRKARIALIRRLLESHEMPEIGAALDTLTGHVNPEAIPEHTLYAMKHPEFRPEPLVEAHAPVEIHGHMPDLRQYDAILGVNRS